MCASATVLPIFDALLGYYTLGFISNGRDKEIRGAEEGMVTQLGDVVAFAEMQSPEPAAQDTTK